MKGTTCQLHSTPRPRRRRPAARRSAGPRLDRLLLGTSATDASGGSPAGDVAAGGSALDAALEKGGDLTYWTWTPSAEAQVAAFEKAYPNVKVNLVNAGGANDQYTKLQNAIKAG